MTALDRNSDSREQLRKQSALARAWTAYPLHPPLTDLTIGAYTTASLLAVTGAAGVSEPDLAKGWWLALLVGLLASIPTGGSGLAEFLILNRNHPARAAAIRHLLLVLPTYPLFLAAILLGHSDYVHGTISAAPLALTLTGMTILSAAGLAGGRLVFGHGIRVKRTAPGSDDAASAAREVEELLQDAGYKLMRNRGPRPGPSRGLHPRRQPGSRSSPTSMEEAMNSVSSTAAIPGYLAGTWTADPVHSEIAFAVRQLMVGKVRGRFTSHDVTIDTSEDPLDSSVAATIDLASIDTGNKRRDNHLRSAAIVAAEKYPMMSYRSIGIQQTDDGWIIDGELTLHGVTRQVPLAVELNRFAPDPYGGQRARFSARAQINRSDFGIHIPMQAAGVMISDKVSISLEIEAVRQK
jgi:polyisoprenoid-binding protein YceI/uncharacterized membrane protein